MTGRPKPTRAELEAARHKTIKDVIRPGLRVLFCGINPGLYSGATGHHFARPGNRFWPALHRSGFTPRLVSPYEERALLDFDLGITNMVARTTAVASELGDEEFVEGGKRLTRKVRRYKPCFLAVLGVTAYRVAFDDKHAVIGPQDKTIGDTRLWALPNPSGLNAHYQLPALAREFRKLLKASAD